MIKWKRKLNGHCPVQAEGYFMKHYFYFRSRGSQATIEFAKTETDWEYQRCIAKYILLDMKDDYAAGWLPKWICRLLVWKGCLKFMLRRK